MTNYFSAMVISSSTDNRLKLRENNSQADAATKLIDIEAGTGQNNRSNSYQAVGLRKSGTRYQYL